MSPEVRNASNNYQKFEGDSPSIFSASEHKDNLHTFKLRPIAGPFWEEKFEESYQLVWGQ